MVALQSHYEPIGYSCYSCGSVEHQLETCPMLHYTPDRTKLIMVYHHQCNVKERTAHDRKRGRWRSLSQVNEISEMAEIF